MVSDITTVITGLVSAITNFLTPTAGSEGSLLNSTAVTALTALFAVPVTVGVVRKVVKLVKSARG